MQIEKVKSSSDGMHLYQTNEFATIQIKFIFLLENHSKKELALFNLLSIYLIRTNQIYKNQKEINNKLQYFYDMKINFELSIQGKQRFFSYRINLIDPKVISENYLNEAITFAHDILFKPNFINESLDKDLLEEIKKELINYKANEISNPNVISYNSFYESIFKGSFLGETYFTDITEVEELVDSITDKEIINFYHNLVDSSFYKGYVFGNISEEEYEKIKDLFSFSKKEVNLNYNEKIELREEYKEINNDDIKQSKLYVAYQIEDYDVNNIHLYKMLGRMLNSQNGLCHRILRDELGLVYSVYASIFLKAGLLYIKAGISEENKDKCLKGIDDIINELQNPNLVKELLEYGKK